MRIGRAAVMTAVVAILANGVAGSVAAANRAPVKDGYYSDLVGVSSADVEFHVRKGGAQTKDLALECTPVDDTQGDGIAVHAPKVRIKHGKLTYDGPATVSGPSGGDPTIGTTTLLLHLKHVNGPVHHYTYDGNHLQETTAWKGSVASPACASIGNDGKVTLFGPVKGE